MACFPCIKCYKCRSFIPKIEIVCASCGEEMPAGVSACPNCGGTQRVARKTERPDEATREDEKRE